MMSKIFDHAEQLAEALKRARDELSESIENEGPFASFAAAVKIIDAALAAWERHNETTKERKNG
jgi:hypothetical protein